MDKDAIQKEFMKGFDCSQVVLMRQAGRMDMDTETLARIGAAFGGGMFRGDTCGAVAGAMAVIGLLYGHCEPGDAETKDKLRAKVAEFQQKFTKRHGTTICRELVNYDFSKGEEEFKKAMESGDLLEFCPVFVADALEILDEMTE